jgi:hypothetical protein
MLTQPIEAFAAFIHSAPQQIARKEINNLTPLEAEQVLLHYRDRFNDYHDNVFWYLKDRMFEKTPRPS